MASLVSQFHADLVADAPLAAVVAERVYANRILKKAGVKATPEAFDTNGIVKPAIVLIDDGMIGDFRRDDAGNATMTAWLHAPDTDAGRVMIDGTMYERVIAVVTSGAYTVTNGTGVEIAIGDRFGVRADPTFEHAVVDYIRFTVARLWR